MMKKGFFILCLVCLSTAANAYEVSPVYQLLDAVGKNSQSSYTLKNIDEKDIIVEVLAFHTQLVNGEELLTPADEKFLILPPQAKIKGNNYQKFRIKYLPSNTIDKTTPYRIIFKQIKIDEQNYEQKNEVEMLINFSTLTFISPQNGFSDPKIDIKNNMLLIRNEGNTVLNMTKLSFTFMKDGKKKQIEWDKINNSSGIYLLPNTEKKFPLHGPLMNVKDIELIYQP